MPENPETKTVTVCVYHYAELIAKEEKLRLMKNALRQSDIFFSVKDLCKLFGIERNEE